jgi:nitrogen regulatory protein P-II 1
LRETPTDPGGPDPWALSVGYLNRHRQKTTKAEPTAMKLVVALIRPSQLEAVKTALADVEIFRLTVMDCQGFGRQKVPPEASRGTEVATNLLRKVQLQIAVNEEHVGRTVKAIQDGGRTSENGEIGDGKVFVLPLEDCIRIRTGERGDEAI